MHIHTLLLGSFSPVEERDFLYSPKGEFHGEAALLLNALEITAPGKTPDAVQGEFQRAGFFLTYVLECPVEPEDTRTTVIASLLAEQLPIAAARIRRSLKPKRVILVTKALEPILDNIMRSELGCPIVMDDGKPFELDSGALNNAVGRLREAPGLREAG
ncbi:MAG TPA: hypothetical protein VFN26_12405 [Candidatus Acidoferrum sp.]|nr:hypothetical protein [Candidatus Acidoferrum sp.]